MFSLWKTKLGYGRVYRPYNDELIISSYSKYLDERETSKTIKLIEYNKNKLSRGNSDLEITLGKIMI